MPKGAKNRKVPATFVRAVVADNVESRMHLMFAESNNKPKALSEAANVSLSTVQRVLDKQTGASIDTLWAIAGVFECSVLELLTPTAQMIRTLGLTRSQASTLIPREWKQSQ